MHEIALSFCWASPDCRAYSQARTEATISRDKAMAASDRLVAKTGQIVNYYTCASCIENPALSRIWKRKGVSDGLLAKSVVTSYCSLGYSYRKNTRLSSSFPLILPICPGRGSCPQMIGNKHKQHETEGVWRLSVLL